MEKGKDWRVAIFVVLLLGSLACLVGMFCIAIHWAKKKMKKQCPETALSPTPNKENKDVSLEMGGCPSATKPVHTLPRKLNDYPTAKGTIYFPTHRSTYGDSYSTHYPV